MTKPDDFKTFDAEVDALTEAQAKARLKAAARQLVKSTEKHGLKDSDDGSVLVLFDDEKT